MSNRAYEPPSWWPEVEAAPYAHDLFHLLLRLDAHDTANPRLGRAWHPSGEPIRIGQQPSLAFAPASVADARTNDGERPRLSILGFGLFGPNGALPLHLTEFIRNRVRNHNDPVLNAFIDLFHHRLTLLFYRAWAQAQPTVNADREDDSAFDRYVASLTHLGLASIPRDHPLTGRAVHGMVSRTCAKDARRARTATDTGNATAHAGAHRRMGAAMDRAGAAGPRGSRRRGVERTARKRLDDRRGGTRSGGQV
ncbi:putative protein ImpH/VasB [Candidatus Burkholderia humilis]|nr:putative protein ImpH/VasB [Candidatus Burkholderia humilis]